MRTTRPALRCSAALLLTLALAAPAAAQPAPLPAGFVSLFNGKDLTGWKVPEGDNGHWKVSTASSTTTRRARRRATRTSGASGSTATSCCGSSGASRDTPYVNPNVPIIRVDGTHKKDADGKEIKLAVPDSDSGVYLRGSSKAQINIWGWPIGSGEVYGYRMDAKMPPEVRAGVTPKAQRGPRHRRSGTPSRSR